MDSSYIARSLIQRHDVASPEDLLVWEIRSAHGLLLYTYMYALVWKNGFAK